MWRVCGCGCGCGCSCYVGVRPVKQKQPLVGCVGPAHSPCFPTSSCAPHGPWATAAVQQPLPPPLARFTFGRPDVELLRRYCEQRFGWSQAQADEQLLPAVQSYDERQVGAVGGWREGERVCVSAHVRVGACASANCGCGGCQRQCVRWERGSCGRAGWAAACLAPGHAMLKPSPLHCLPLPLHLLRRASRPSTPSSP